MVMANEIWSPRPLRNSLDPLTPLWISRSSRSIEFLAGTRTWRRNWLKHYERDVRRGAHFVVFLSRD